MGGSRVVPETGRGLVASTGKARGWISLGDFTGDKEREIIYQPKENFGLNAKFLQLNFKKNMTDSTEN